MISSNNEHVFIHDLSDLTWQIIFNAGWASMNVGSKMPIACNKPRHASWWPFYLHCGIEECDSPGIICIVRYQVLHHPSEHGTSPLGKQLPAKVHISNVNELTESEGTELTSSKVDETALAILKRQGSQGIAIVSSQGKFIFDIQVNPYWLKLQTQRCEMVAKDFETSECHQHTWNRYFLLGFNLAQIPWNAKSNLQLQQSYKVIWSDLRLLSATPLSNIFRRENVLTVDAIEQHLVSRKQVSLALDGGKSRNKLTTSSVIAYRVDRQWPLLEVQLTYDEVDHLFLSRFES